MFSNVLVVAFVVLFAFLDGPVVAEVVVFDGVVVAVVSVAVIGDAFVVVVELDIAVLLVSAGVVVAD